MRHRKVRVNNLKSAISASIICASKNHSNTVQFTVKSIASKFELECKHFNMIKSIQRYLCQIRKIIELTPVDRDQEIQSLVLQYCNLIENPSLCSAYRDRVDSQYNSTIQQIKTNEILSNRTNPTIAATIICAALYKLPIIHQKTKYTVSSQWITNLTKVSHGRIQSTLKMITRIEQVNIQLE